MASKGQYAGQAIRGEPMGPDDAFVPGIASLSPYNGRIFSPAWRGRYPHLMPLDRTIWDRFLERYGGEFLGVQYDVLLGEGAVPLSNFSEMDRRLLYYATVKRADCLLIQKDRVILVEVKPRLGMAALGQCFAYYMLWKRQYPYTSNVEVAWVGEQSEPDIEYCMNRLGFRVIMV